MRLIEAEALKQSVREKFKALSDRCEINELVNAAPTVDAITVEWLRTLQEKEGVGSSGWVAIEVIIQLWDREQKKQEAR